MPFFERDQIRFHFRDSGEGFPFFFQHGLGADVSQPFNLFQPPPGFRMIAFDCRAHGQTSPMGALEKISLNTFADDLKGLMEFLSIEKAVVGGISMGAATAQNFTLRYPERVLGLVLQRPAWLAEPNARNIEIFGFVSKLILEDGPQVGLEKLKASKLYADVLAESSDCAKSLTLQFANPRAAETAMPLERIAKDAPNYDPAEWKGIKCPTLVLANRQDPIHPFEFGEILAREIPNAVFREVMSKSMSVEGYQRDTQRFIGEFLTKNFGPAKEAK